MKFNRAADTYDKYAWHQAEAAKTLLSLSGLPEKASSVLDLGCGTGLASRAAADRYPEAVFTGLDISPDMLKAYRRRFEEVDLIEADLRTYTFEKPADLVISSFAMQWVDTFNPIPFPTVFALAVPIEGSLPEFLNTSFPFRPVNFYRDLLTRNGLRIVTEEIKTFARSYASAKDTLDVFHRIGALPEKPKPLSIGETRALLRNLTPSITYETAFFIARND